MYIIRLLTGGFSLVHNIGCRSETNCSTRLAHHIRGFHFICSLHMLNRCRASEICRREGTFISYTPLVSDTILSYKRQTLRLSKNVKPPLFVLRARLRQLLQSHEHWTVLERPLLLLERLRRRRPSCNLSPQNRNVSYLPSGGSSGILLNVPTQ